MRDRRVLALYRGFHRPYRARRRRARELCGLKDRLRSVGAGLGELRASQQASLGSESKGFGARDVDSERLRRMVERFTIFTHKKAAGAIGRFAVEEGGKAGEVTLF